MPEESCIDKAVRIAKEATQAAVDKKSSGAISWAEFLALLDQIEEQLAQDIIDCFMQGNVEGCDCGASGA